MSFRLAPLLCSLWWSWSEACKERAVWLAAGASHCVLGSLLRLISALQGPVLPLLPPSHWPLTPIPAEPAFLAEPTLPTRLTPPRSGAHAGPATARRACHVPPRGRRLWRQGQP
jgi:hypothetical protein